MSSTGTAKVLLPMSIGAVADRARYGVKKEFPKPSPLNDEFRKLVHETLEKWHIQGVSVAVVDGDQTWAEGYGIAELPDNPVQPSTLFWAGSTTKSFTAAAASLLVDDDKTYPDVQWTTPLHQLLSDDFVLPEEYATAHVTVEDALSNRSGMPGHVLTLGRMGTVRDAVRNLRHFKLNKEIRTTWQYCNAMFITVSHMIEVATGEWLGDFLRKRIWDPLQMSSTFFSLDDAKRHVACMDNNTNLAVPYGWDHETSQAKQIPYCEGVLSGAGAIISNVEDYAKYIRSMMRQSGPLSKEGYAAVLQPRSFVPPMLPQLKQQMLYALGWMVTTYQGERVWLHPGGLEGMTATMICFPDRDWGVLVFCNADGPGRETLAWHLIDNMLNVPAASRVDLYDVVQKHREEKRQLNDAAQDRLYPSFKSPRPLSLPLQSYAGTYMHPAHPDFIISVVSDETEEPRLEVCVTGAIRSRLVLKHVSADYFLAEIWGFVHSTDPDAVVRAEFQVDAAGKVKRFGAAADYEDMPDTLIWFERKVHPEETEMAA